MNPNQDTEKAKKIKERLISYSSRAELIKSVAANLKWEDIGDNCPGNSFFLEHPKSPHVDHFPGEDLADVLRYLPNDHELMQEIIVQTKSNLEEILTKSRQELSFRIPKFLNAFTVADLKGYSCLFEAVKIAAYHVLELCPIKDVNTSNEAFIIRYTARGMGGYIPEYPLEVKSFIDKMWEKRAALPYVVTIGAELRDTQAIERYFELFESVRGTDYFVFDGIKQRVDFWSIGKHNLKQFFPDYDFFERIDKVSGEWLRGKLREIFC